MKRLQWIAERVKTAMTLTVVIFCGCWSHAAVAQTNVALIDMAQVFDNHPTFKQQLQTLKHDADALQNLVLQQREQIAKDAESANLVFQSGSQQFKDKEKELATRMAQLEVESKNSMRDLMAREARLHYDVYREVNQLVENYCQANEVRLVLRYNRPAQNQQDPEAIMQLINGMVVYHQPSQDITAAIIQSLRGATPLQSSQGNLPSSGGIRK